MISRPESLQVFIDSNHNSRTLAIKPNTSQVRLLLSIQLSSLSSFNHHSKDLSEVREAWLPSLISGTSFQYTPLLISTIIFTNPSISSGHKTAAQTFTKSALCPAFCVPDRPTNSLHPSAHHQANSHHHTFGPSASMHDFNTNQIPAD